MKTVKFLWLLLIIVSVCLPQVRVGDWQYYTSVLHIKDIIYLNNKIYCTTSGGLISYDPESKTFERLNETFKINSYDLSSVEADKYGALWIGTDYPEATIYVIAISEGKVVQVFDESTWGKNLSSIQGFAFTKDSAFAIYQENVDWGLLFFKYNRAQKLWEYREFYKNFPTDVYRINRIKILDNKIFLCTDNGLFHSTLSPGTNLLDRNSWKLVEYSQGSQINDIMLYNGHYILNMGNYVYQTSDFINFQHLFHTKYPILSLESLSSLIFALEARRIFIYSYPDDRIEYFGYNDFTDFTVDPQGNIWAGSAAGITLLNQDRETVNLIPNTPITNIYTSLLIDKNGNLIAASSKGISFFEKGRVYNIVFKLNRKGIKNRYNYSENFNDLFLADTIPVRFGSLGIINTILKRGDYFYSDLSHTGILDINKGGILKFDVANLADYQVFDTTNGYVAGSEGKGGARDYVVLGRMKMDAKGNIWFCNEYAQNDNVIGVITPDDKFLHFSIEDSRGYLSYHPNDIAFDAAGRVWIAMITSTSEVSPSYGGIAVLDHKNTPFDKSDDEWYWITERHGLASNNVFSIAFDKNGELWILTSEGVQRAEISSKFPEKIFYTIDRPVLTAIAFDRQCMIKVDAMNNKWITTSSAGVKLYTSDGIWYNRVEGFTSHNSGLLSDKILDIAFYEPEGLVYFATSKGICVLKSEFGFYGNEYRRLKIFPSPYKIPSASPVIIDGLLQNSTVKIFTIDGLFIRKLSRQNGTVIGTQAYWDGKNYNGEYVTTGIYIIFAYIPEGKHTVAKIAVIKK